MSLVNGFRVFIYKNDITVLLSDWRRQGSHEQLSLVRHYIITGRWPERHLAMWRTRVTVSHGYMAGCCDWLASENEAKRILRGRRFERTEFSQIAPNTNGVNKRFNNNNNYSICQSHSFASKKLVTSSNQSKASRIVIPKVISSVATTTSRRRRIMDILTYPKFEIPPIF